MKHTDIIKAIKAASTNPNLSYVQLGLGEATVTNLDSYVIVKNEIFDNHVGDVTLVDAKQFTGLFAKSFDGINYIHRKWSYKQATLEHSDKESITFSDVAGDVEFEEWFNVPSKSFINALQGSNSFMAKNDVRYYLNGLNLNSVDSTLSLTASDGHRLLNRVSDIKPFFDASVIVYRDVIKLIESFKADDSEVAVYLGKSDVYGETKFHWIKFKFSDVTIITRLHDSKYPDFSRVLNQHFDDGELTNVKKSLKTLKEVKNLVTGKHKGVKLFNNGKVTDENDNELCYLPITFKGDFEFIALNYNYLVDSISAISVESCTVKTDQDVASIVFEYDNTKVIQMAMRL